MTVSWSTKRERIPQKRRKHPSKESQNCLPSQTLLWKNRKWVLLCSASIANENPTDMLPTILCEKQPQYALPNLICMHYLTHGPQLRSSGTSWCCGSGIGPFLSLVSKPSSGLPSSEGWLRLGDVLPRWLILKALISHLQGLSISVYMYKDKKKPLPDEEYKRTQRSKVEAMVSLWP